MTTTQIQIPAYEMSKGAQEALVDQLRACQSEQEILDFERWFNSKANIGPLHEVICDFLRNRSISRGLAAKWLLTIINQKAEKKQ
tara:strand:- start:210 stop:464 length:255 start_codon:yes stop_codon:yes gene_type:complete